MCHREHSRGHDQGQGPCLETRGGNGSTIFYNSVSTLRPCTVELLYTNGRVRVCICRVLKHYKIASLDLKNEQSRLGVASREYPLPDFPRGYGETSEEAWWRKAEGVCPTMASLYPALYLTLPLHVQHRLPPALQSADFEAVMLLHSVRFHDTCFDLFSCRLRHFPYFLLSFSYMRAMRYRLHSLVSSPAHRLWCRRSCPTFLRYGSPPFPSMFSGFRCGPAMWRPPPLW